MSLEVFTPLQFFLNSLKRTVISSWNVWWHSPGKLSDPGLFFVRRFLITISNSLVIIGLFRCFIFFESLFIYWSIVDLQLLSSFNIQQWFSYIYICMYVCIYFFSGPWEFPGGLAGGPCYYHCTGWSSAPGCRTKIPQAMRPPQKAPQNNPLKQIIIRYRLLQDTEYNSVLSTACPCWLSFYT